MDKIFWQKKCDKFRDTMNEILNEFERIYGEKYSEPYFEMKKKFRGHLIQNGLADTDGKISESLKKLATFHIYAGSTPDYELSPFLDFPGELSIVKYWEKVLEELKKTPTIKSL